jgi:NitT/TauT family transport system substrate-binding protein
MKIFPARLQGYLATLVLALSVCLVISLPLGAAELTTIRLGHNGLTSEIPFYVGRDAGIFAKHGINLEPVLITGGSTSIQALIGNSLDLLLGGATPMLYAVLRGAQMKIVAGLNNRIPFALLSQPEIRTGAQLKGKKVGITRFGSNLDFIARLAAAEFGLNPKSDITILQTGSPDARLSALRSGAIDATFFNIEQAMVARKLGFNLLLDFIEKDIEYAHISIIARDETLKSQPDRLRRFLRAYVEAIRYHKTHKEEAVKKSLQLQRNLDRQIAEQAYHINLKTLPDDARVSVKGVQLVIDAAALEDPKAKNYTPQQLMDLSFLP